MNIKSTKNNIILFFNFLIFFFCAYIIYKYLILENAINYVTSISSISFFLASIVLILAIILDSLRYGQIISSKKEITTLNNSYFAKTFFYISVFLSSMSLSYVVPGSIGVEGYRIMKLGKIVKKIEVASSIITLRLINFSLILLIICIVFTFSPVVFFELLSQNTNIQISFIYIILLFLIFLLIFRYKTLIYNSLIYYINFVKDIPITDILTIYFYSIAIEVLRFLSLLIIIDAMGIDLPIILVLGISAISTLSLIIPFTINGIGIREALIVIFLDISGVILSMGIAFAVIARIASVVPVIVGAILLILKTDDLAYSSLAKSN